MLDLSRVWPEWKAVEKIGEGSFGKVYKCEREEFGIKSVCAIKIISIPQSQAELESMSFEGVSKEGARTYYGDVVKDFANEIKLMEMLKGAPNVVNVENFRIIERENEIGWDIYIRMEYLQSFVSYSKNRKFTEAEVKKFALDISNALDVCSKNGVIHRDVKPDNIFVDKFGSFKLGDFGVARKLEGTMSVMSKKGTYSYMAPEVFRGEKYDCRADIYSLGMVMYKLLNRNRDPFVDVNSAAIGFKERNEAIERRRRGEKLPAPVDASLSMAAVILKACEFKAEDRYATVADFKAAILGTNEAPAVTVAPVEEEATVAARDYFDKTVAAREFELPTPAPAQADFNDETVVIDNPITSDDTMIIGGYEPTAIDNKSAAIYDKDATVIADEDPNETVIADAPYDVPTDVAEDGDISAKDGKGKNKKKTVIIVIAVLCVLGMLAALGWLLDKNAKKANDSASVSESVVAEDDHYHYTTAKELIESGDYAEAYAHLVNCIDYEDSEKLLKNFCFTTMEGYYGDDRFIKSYVYDKNGYLTSVTNETNLAMPYKTVYENDEYGNAIRVIVYDESGNVTDETRYEYDYDENGNIISKFCYDQYDVIWHKECEYIYDEYGNVTLYVQYDEDGYEYYREEVVNEYDADGNITRSTGFVEDGYDSYDFELDYDEYGNVIQEIILNPNGEMVNKVVYRYKFTENSYEERSVFYNELGEIDVEYSFVYSDIVAYKK